MIGTCFVESLATQCLIGCNTDERRTPQAILIDISCEVDMDLAVQSDKREDCVDYCDLHRIALERATTSSYKLLEALACDIASRITDLPHVRATTIRIRKPHKLAGAASVGISLTVRKEDLRAVSHG